MLTRRSVESIPNVLTTLRLLLIPVLIVLLLEPTRVRVNVAIAIFIFAAITDAVDGFVARRFGAVSDIGKLFDPIADKLLVMSVLVMLVGLRSRYQALPWVPHWMVVMILARETWITGLRGMAATRGIVLPAGGAGKIKSLLQMVAIVFLLLHDRSVYSVDAVFGARISGQVVGLNLLLASIVFSYAGAVSYTMQIVPLLKTEQGRR